MLFLNSESFITVLFTLNKTASSLGTVVISSSHFCTVVFKTLSEQMVLFECKNFCSKIKHKVKWLGNSYQDFLK